MWGCNFCDVGKLSLQKFLMTVTRVAESPIYRSRPISISHTADPESSFEMGSPLLCLVWLWSWSWLLLCRGRCCLWLRLTVIQSIGLRKKSKKVKKEVQGFPWGSRHRTDMDKKIELSQTLRNDCISGEIKPLPWGIGVKSDALSIALAHQLVMPWTSRQYINCLKRPKTV